MVVDEDDSSFQDVEKTRSVDAQGYFYPLIMDESMSNVYAHSDLATQEMEGQSTNYKRAAFMGRQVQDPLGCICGIVGSRPRDLLSVKLHPNQDDVAQEALLQAYQQVLMNTVALTGVDINLIKNYRHKSHALGFVSGLGPRKAKELVDYLTNHSKIKTRAQLVGLLGEQVFQNACSFLRVRKGGLVDEDCDHDSDSEDDYKENLEGSSADVKFNTFCALGDLRVHHSHYGFAASLAVTAGRFSSKPAFKPNPEDREEVETRNGDMLQVFAIQPNGAFTSQVEGLLKASMKKAHDACVRRQGRCC